MRFAEPFTRKVPSISVAVMCEWERNEKGRRCTVFFEIETAVESERGGRERGWRRTTLRRRRGCSPTRRGHHLRLRLIFVRWPAGESP